MHRFKNHLSVIIYHAPLPALADFKKSGWLFRRLNIIVNTFHHQLTQGVNHTLLCSRRDHEIPLSVFITIGGEDWQFDIAINRLRDPESEPIHNAPPAVCERYFVKNPIVYVP